MDTGRCWGLYRLLDWWLCSLLFWGCPSHLALHADSLFSFSLATELFFDDFHSLLKVARGAIGSLRAQEELRASSTVGGPALRLLLLLAHIAGSTHLEKI